MQRRSCRFRTALNDESALETVTDDLVLFTLNGCDDVAELTSAVLFERCKKGSVTLVGVVQLVEVEQFIFEVDELTAARHEVPT